MKNRGEAIFSNLIFQFQKYHLISCYENHFLTSSHFPPHFHVFISYAIIVTLTHINMLFYIYHPHNCLVLALYSNRFTGHHQSFHYCFLLLNFQLFLNYISSSVFQEVLNSFSFSHVIKCWNFIFIYKIFMYI